MTSNALPSGPSHQLMWKQTDSAVASQAPNPLPARSMYPNHGIPCWRRPIPDTRSLAPQLIPPQPLPINFPHNISPWERYPLAPICSNFSPLQTSTFAVANFALKQVSDVEGTPTHNPQRFHEPHCLHFTLQSTAHYLESSKAFKRANNHSEEVPLPEKGQKRKILDPQDVLHCLPVTKATRTESLTTNKSDIKVQLATTFKVSEVVNDFYTQPLSLSKAGEIAIAANFNVILKSQRDSTILKRPIYTALSGDILVNNITSLCWLGTGRFLAIGTLQGFLEICSIGSKMDVLGRIKISNTRISTIVQLCKDLVAVGSCDGIISVVNISKPQPMLFRSFQGHGQFVRNLSLSPNGRYLASAGGDNAVNIWNISKSLPIRSFCSHVSTVNALAWHPLDMDSLLATGGGEDRTIKLWNVDKNKELCSINTEGHVTNLHWLRDGKHLISTHAYSTNNKEKIRLWQYSYSCANDVYTLTEIPLGWAVNMHTNMLLHSALSFDGNQLVTLGMNKVLMTWDIVER